MRPVHTLRSTLISALGVVVCAWSAALLSYLFVGRPMKFYVPLAFLALVCLIAIRCGITAGILGSAAAAVIFACFLYAPLGSISVKDELARGNLAWLILGGVVFSYLLAPDSGKREHHN